MPKLQSWRLFEFAVAEFAKSLVPAAKVTHNSFEADRHHGMRRQRDVLIHTVAMKLFPITAWLAASDTCVAHATATTCAAAFS